MVRFLKLIYKIWERLKLDRAVSSSPPNSWSEKSLVPGDNLKIVIRQQIPPLPPFANVKGFNNEEASQQRLWVTPKSFSEFVLKSVREPVHR